MCGRRTRNSHTCRLHGDFDKAMEVREDTREDELTNRRFTAHVTMPKRLVLAGRIVLTITFTASLLNRERKSEGERKSEREKE